MAYAHLPNEILAEIFNLLDSPSYVESHLTHDPAHAFDPTGKPTGPDARAEDLKSIALTCRQWAAVAQPRLFRHLQLRLPLPGLVQSQKLLQFVRFVRDNLETLQQAASSVTVVLLEPKRDEIAAGTPAFDDERFFFEDEFLVNGASEFMSFDPLAQLWDAVISLRPQRVTLMGWDPVMAVYLPGRGNYRPFRFPPRHPHFRILSLSREDMPWEETPSHTRGSVRAPAGKLLNMCLWTHLLINEGSGLMEHFAKGRSALPNLPASFGMTPLDVRTAVFFPPGGGGGGSSSSSREKSAYQHLQLNSITFLCDFHPFDLVGTAIKKLYRQGGQRKVFHVRTLPEHFDLDAFVKSPAADAVDRGQLYSAYEPLLQDEHESEYDVDPETWPHCDEALREFAGGSPGEFVLELPDVALTSRLWRDAVATAVGSWSFREDGVGRFVSGERRQLFAAGYDSDEF